MPSIAAVLLDLDGTLLDHAGSARRALAAPVSVSVSVSVATATVAS